VKLNLEPVANLMVRANDAFAAFEGMLIAEIAAGNANAGTPMAACGRVAFGIAWAAARTHILPKLSGLALQDEASQASPTPALAA
jgi:hypothetical protein